MRRKSRVSYTVTIPASGSKFRIGSCCTWRLRPVPRRPQEAFSAPARMRPRSQGNRQSSVKEQVLRPRILDRGCLPISARGRIQRIRISAQQVQTFGALDRRGGSTPRREGWHVRAEVGLGGLTRKWLLLKAFSARPKLCGAHAMTQST